MRGREITFSADRPEPRQQLEAAAGQPVPALDRALPYVATVAASFSVAYSLRFIHGVFFGPDPVGLPRTPHEPPHWMRFPIELLVLARQS